MSIFESDKIISEDLIGADLSVYLINYDIDDNGDFNYRLNEFIEVLTNAIPEFAFGCNNKKININDALKIVKEAARAVYRVKCINDTEKIYTDGKEIEDTVDDKELRRGEFGELILHVLLRDFKKTIPLISKIYFKDSVDCSVHGFDAVHINIDDKTLWLGEAKIYKSGKNGIKSLIDDIKEHINRDYMKNEFAIISRKVELYNDYDVPERKYWLSLLNGLTSLKEQLNKIVIPLLCVYDSEVVDKYNNNEDKMFKLELNSEISKLKQYFIDKNDHKLNKMLEIKLLLFPIKSKKELIKKLHNQLKKYQI